MLARRSRALPRRLLRRAGAAAATRDRQRRELLAHARSAHPADDQRRTGRAGRARDLHGRDGRCRRASWSFAASTSSQDINTFAELAARRVPVGILDNATRGHPERSLRYRDLLEPAGIPHELRAAFVIRGRVWGAVHIARRAQSGAFTQRDADALARVAGAIANGIRASLRFDAARRGDRRRGARPDRPGRRERGRADHAAGARPCSTRSAAMPWLRPETRSPPAACWRSRRSSAAARGAAAHESNVVTVPSRAGWITLHASLPERRRRPRRDRDRAAPAAQSATLRLEVSGVTAREREVATLLAARPAQRGDRRRARALAAHGRRTTSRACSRSSASPRATSSSHACSSTSTSPR